MSHDIETIAVQLRQAGFRMTPQRQLILDAVCKSGGHVTPEDVYTRVSAIAPTLNQATVYRTLHFLSEQGIITVTQLADGRFCYEIAGPEPHHHLVCRSCKTSIELPHQMLRLFNDAVAGEYGFAIDMNHISFFGLCANCRDKD
ncbi:MAG: Fur family transcriptional regulator [Anaerolineae bacterium]